MCMYKCETTLVDSLRVLDPENQCYPRVYLVRRVYASVFSDAVAPGRLRASQHLINSCPPAISPKAFTPL